MYCYNRRPHTSLCLSLSSCSKFISALGRTLNYCIPLVSCWDILYVAAVAIPQSAAWQRVHTWLGQVQAKAFIKRILETKFCLSGSSLCSNFVIQLLVLLLEIWLQLCTIDDILWDFQLSSHKGHLCTVQILTWSQWGVLNCQ